MSLGSRDADLIRLHKEMRKVAYASDAIKQLPEAVRTEIKNASDPAAKQISLWQHDQESEK